MHAAEEKKIKYSKRRKKDVTAMGGGGVDGVESRLLTYVNPGKKGWNEESRHGISLKGEGEKNKEGREFKREERYPSIKNGWAFNPWG